MKLICETIEDIRYLKEENETGKKSYFIEGVFLMGNETNKNGRVYPVNVLEREVERYNKEYVDKKRAFGELGHPAGPTINLERVSHLITNLKREGSDFIGKAQVLETPYGNIVKNLIDVGAQLGVSSRGMGRLEEKNGVMEVQDDFRLSTAADIVADPSAHKAFVNNVMESVDWVMDAGVWAPHFVEKAKKHINNAYGSLDRSKIEEATLATFENFLSKLKSK